MNKRALALRLARYNETLDKVNWIARWRETMSGHDAPRFADRYELYQHVNGSLGDGPITYLEFGVASGKSLRAWVEQQRHPDSRFVGFDTFTGLPENWNQAFGKGAFSMDGAPPPIDDPRIRFVAGMFQQTLRPFLRDLTVRGRLVVHMDADLYSSTLYVLTQLDAIMPAGTVLLFDEFQSFLHEFRAWHDYLAAYGRTWKLLGLARGGVHAAVELT